MSDIKPTDFVDVPNPPAGKTSTQFLNPNFLTPIQGIAPINPTPPAAIGDIFTQVDAVIDADRAANTPGTTPATGTNIHFTDLTVGISGDVTGDQFKGGITDIKTQFIGLTPDNLLIQATAPNEFLLSGSGDDILISGGGRTILDGGSGRNVFVAGNGHDTIIQDASKAGGTAYAENLSAGDEVVVFGVKLNDFTLSTADSVAGLTFTLTGNGPAASRSTEVILPGFSTADIKAGKLSTFLSVSGDGSHDYLGFHVNS